MNGDDSSARNDGWCWLLPELAAGDFLMDDDACDDGTILWLSKNYFLILSSKFFIVIFIKISIYIYLDRIHDFEATISNTLSS